MTELEYNQQRVSQSEIIDIVEEVVGCDDYGDWITTTDMYEYMDKEVPRNLFTRKMKNIRGSWDCISHRIPDEGALRYEYTYEEVGQ